jgi:hypothetical protein
MNLPQHDHKLTTRSEIAISEAIQNGAQKCLGHPDPFACAEAFAIALIADGWTAQGARQVQIGSLRVLAQITGEDTIWPPA